MGAIYKFKMVFLLGFGLLFSPILAEEKPEKENKSEVSEEKESPKKSEPGTKIKNEKLQNHLMENVDIFGKNNMPSVFILGLGPMVDPEVEKALLTRDFTRDAFFMQNIDRESFELRSGGYNPRMFSEEKENPEE